MKDENFKNGLRAQLENDVRATFAREHSPEQMQALEPIIQRSVTETLANKELMEWARQQTVAQQQEREREQQRVATQYADDLKAKKAAAAVQSAYLQ